MVILFRRRVVFCFAVCLALSTYPVGAEAAELLTKSQLEARIAQLRADGRRLETLFCFRQGNKTVFQIVKDRRNRGNKEWHWAIAHRLRATDEEMRKKGFKRVSHHKYGSIHECMVWVKR